MIFTAALLTEHSEKCLDQHYLQDLSLVRLPRTSEYRGQGNQNDILRRSEDSLEQYEAKLGLVLQEQKLKEQLRSFGTLLAKAEEKESRRTRELLRFRHWMKSIIFSNKDGVLTMLFFWIGLTDCREFSKNLRGRGRLSESDVNECMREVRLALLEADVNFKVVKDLLSRA